MSNQAVVQEIKSRYSAKWSEICNGAFCVIRDGGAFYGQWKGCGQRRISSHRSAAEQYEIGPLSVDGKPGVLLVGCRRGGNSFFQFEAHSGTGQDLASGIAHLVDWGIHEVTGQQVGPWGRSIHTDHHPLYLG